LSRLPRDLRIEFGCRPIKYSVSSSFIYSNLSDARTVKNAQNDVTGWVRPDENFTAGCPP
jgi:hypothetical protein